MNQKFSKTLFLPLLFFILSIFIISVGSLFIYQNEHVKDSAKDRFEKISKIYDKKFEKDVDIYETFIKLISKDQKAIKLFLNSDRKGLYTYYKDLNNQLKTKYNITHFYFHKIDKKNFLRVHNPKVHSDTINRFTLNQSIRTKNLAYGIEFGISHNLTLRVVYPWFVNNKIIGYIELGKEIDYFSPELAKLENCEVIYTINKDLINKEDYNKWINHSKNNQKFKELKNFYIIDFSFKNISNNLLRILDENKKIKNVTVNNKSSIYKAFNKPFYDLNGKKIGNLFIFCNMTREYNFVYSLFKDSSIVILLLFTILLIYYFIKLKNTEKDIDHKHQEMFSISITDSLSKLYNRRHFDHSYPQRLKRSKENKSKLSFLIIDIDNFKKYNDRYGHQEGDEVIKKVATTIKDTFKRKSDQCYRVGGEEFVVLTETRDEKHAKDIALLLKENVESLNIEHLDNESFNKITISIGVYIVNDYDIDSGQIYKNADDALYLSKQKGRNQITIFNEAFDI
ncbi:MAG: diguanylate cyclase [Halarcobacter sp.]